MTHPGSILLLSVLTLLTVLLVFAMKYWSAARRADLQSASAHHYRALAEQLLALQSASSGQLHALEHQVGDVKAKLTRIETILRDVE